MRLTLLVVITAFAVIAAGTALPRQDLSGDDLLARYATPDASA